MLPRLLLWFMIFALPLQAMGGLAHAGCPAHDRLRNDAAMGLEVDAEEAVSNADKPCHHNTQHSPSRGKLDPDANGHTCDACIAMSQAAGWFLGFWLWRPESFEVAGRTVALLASFIPDGLLRPPSTPV
ncbi:hypothetical protein GCM10009080_46470 [Cupriavidus pauculus]